MPQTGYFHNSVPIPVPPLEVLNMALSNESLLYLILVSDSKQNWQWLLRDKLTLLRNYMEADMKETCVIQEAK